MTLRIRFRSLLFVAVCLVSTVSVFAADFKSPVGKLNLTAGDSIVFLGDSITHQCLYTQYVEDFFYTRFPKMRLKFHNSGVGGARAIDALERFDRDVASYKPKYVTVLLGMNDGTYKPYDEETFRTYHKDMTELIGRIKGIGAIPILMTPTMYDSRAARLNPRRNTPAATLELYNSVLSYYGTWLREVAVENCFGFVDMYTPLNQLTLQQRKTNPNFTMIRDAVHPDAPGQLVMAYSIIDDMGLRGQVSNIRILGVGGKKMIAQSTRGKVSGLKRTDTGLEFTFTADSLPWILPEEAEIGNALLKLGHRASKEGVEVHGLRVGRYELSIDGKTVGVYSSVQLSRHIELQGNSKTPQYQQALKVAELNKQRNTGPVNQQRLIGPVKLLRNEWRKFQQYSRATRNETEDINKKKQIASLKKQLQGMEDRIAQHEAAARDLEDQIFETNQPKPRKYVLKRVTR
jgi:lysophospholipase L1-like esterase